jgi:isopentenyldiphosphate isomerase
MNWIRCISANTKNAPSPNPLEVCEWTWMDIEALKADLENDPEKYVYWLKAAFNEFYLNYQRLKSK